VIKVSKPISFDEDAGTDGGKPPDGDDEEAADTASSGTDFIVLCPERRFLKLILPPHLGKNLPGRESKKLRGANGRVLHTKPDITSKTAGNRNIGQPFLPTQNNGFFECEPPSPPAARCFSTRPILWR